MVKMSDIARITLEGLDSQVDEDSPLVEQASLVYEAARRFAKTQSFKEIYYLNQHRGWEGPFVMKRLITDLFPRASREKLDAISSAVGQVLRRSVAAVCTKKPSKDDGPVWFIAAELPPNMGDIATGVATLNHRPASQLTYAERKLTEHEAGEDREPAEVVVTRTAEEVNDVTERIFEEIATSLTPITVTELTEIINELPRWQVNHAVSALLKEGRLFARLETEEEGLVRTAGNGRPHARKPRLLWPSEPVPMRTTLPTGASPLRSSQQWADQRGEIQAADERLILEYLVRPPQGGRSTGKIARAIGIEHHRTKRILDEMVNRGTLRLSKPAGLYYLATDKQRAKPILGPAATVSRSSSPAESPAPKSASTIDPAELLEQFVEAAVTKKTVELQEEIRTLRAERDDLKAKLQRIQEQF